MARKRIQWNNVDDFFTEHVNLEIIRIGDARYTMRIVGEEAQCEIIIWTTRKSKIHVRELWTDAPSAITLLTDSKGVLEHCTAENVSIHFENMGRDLYFLGIYHEDGKVGVFLSAEGYLKTHIVQAHAEKPEIER